ncbi:hypothetical protein [Aurantimonas endophytica]|uniref:hypothetical protein n=1 Tax=Aurantimonas endophytica TaxID=1522175 RepID=UPI003001B3CF
MVLEDGQEPTMIQPAGEGAGFGEAIKTTLMVICSIAGILSFEAMQDWSAALERAMCYAGAGPKRRVTRERRAIERNILRRMWRDFVDICIVTGMWTPPADAKAHEIYDVAWKWDVVQTAALDRELNTMLAMVKAGILPPSSMVEDYFGLEWDDFLRQYAGDVAKAHALGLKGFADTWSPDTAIAVAILTEAEVAEQYERDLIDGAKTDTSVVGNPTT